MVESGGLENRCAGNPGTVGSNPTPSAHMATASVRYIVDDVEAAVSFYSGSAGFDVDAQPGPGFAIRHEG